MTFLAVRKHKKSPGKGLDCDYLFEKKALLEVVVFCHDLMYYFQSVCLEQSLLSPDSYIAYLHFPHSPYLLFPWIGRSIRIAEGSFSSRILPL